MKKHKRRSILLNILLTILTLSSVSCDLFQNNNDSTEKTSKTDISNFINDTIEVTVLTDVSEFTQNKLNDSASDTYIAEVEVATVDLLEIYKSEQTKNPQVSSYSNDQIMELLINNSSESSLHRETVTAEVIEVNGEWVLASDEAVQSIVRTQVNELLAYIMNDIGVINLEKHMGE